MRRTGVVLAIVLAFSCKKDGGDNPDGPVADGPVADGPVADAPGPDANDVPEEVCTNLGTIRGLGFQYFALNNQIPSGDTGPTPAAIGCCTTGGTCQPDGQIWTGIWISLGFQVSAPSRYSYQYISNQPDTFTARANGDLDCDGVYSTFELIGAIDTDASAPGDCAGMFKDHPLE